MAANLAQGFSRNQGAIRRETDCLLEGAGFEPSVPLVRPVPEWLVVVVGKKLEHEIEQLHCFCDFHLEHWPPPGPSHSKVQPQPSRSRPAADGLRGGESRHTVRRSPRPALMPRAGRRDPRPSGQLQPAPAPIGSDDSALALACMSATSGSMATTQQRAPRARPHALRKSMAADYARPQPAHFHDEAEVVYSSAELVFRSGPVH
jgi:hypothetical protein